jgi:putative SOS response-associated peptidase YedK
MCGRYTLTKVNPEQLAATFSLETVPAEFLTPRYNIAPTQLMPVVIQNADGINELVNMRWGLVPSWSKDAKRAGQMINARSETLIEKPSFRDAYKKRRCLVVADGFYEWKANSDGPKTPLYIKLRDSGLFGLAGLWERWREPETGEFWTTCTIVTTTPNSLLESIHNRMPVILPREDYNTWLNPKINEPMQLEPLLKSYPAEEMEYYEVSPRVNNARVDASDLIQPVSRG